MNKLHNIGTFCTIVEFKKNYENGKYINILLNKRNFDTSGRIIIVLFFFLHTEPIF